MHFSRPMFERDSLVGKQYYGCGMREFVCIDHGYITISWEGVGLNASIGYRRRTGFGHGLGRFGCAWYLRHG